MKIKELQKNKGFTIIEAIVAIFILSISVTAMLGLIVTSLSTAKYANNDITVNYLLQEAVDAVRNSRDTIVLQSGGNWTSFKNKYSYCISTNGCYFSLESFNPSIPNPIACPDYTCSASTFKYDNTGIHLFYNYSTGTLSNFKRKVVITDFGNELQVVATVEWKNGTSTKSRTLETRLLNWYK